MEGCFQHLGRICHEHHCQLNIDTVSFDLITCNESKESNSEVIQFVFIGSWKGWLLVAMTFGTKI